MSVPASNETQTHVDGWNTTTLFAHLSSVFGEMDRRYEQRFEAQEIALKTAFASLQSIHTEQNLRFEQRFAAQETAIAVATSTITGLLEERDRRYEERFHAQQEALVVALAVVNKEFHEHIIQVRDETQAALHAADKAIVKSEIATEKRFESVNEFRAQLSDQTGTFIPRKEAETRIAAVAEKLEAAEARLVGQQAGMGSRLDLMQGQAQGGRDQVSERRQNHSALYAAIGIGITVTLFLMTLAGYLVGR